MREGERHSLRGREAVLAVQNHAVTAVEHDHRGAGTLVLALRDHQIRIIYLVHPGTRDSGFGIGRPEAPDGIQYRAAGIDVQGVAELVWLRRGRGLDTGAEMAGVVPAGVAPAD